MSNPNDFVIKNGVLTKYQGPGGDVVIPDGVTAIAGWAFSGCNSLTSVIIPEGVTTIGGMAFYECSNLTRVTIPESVTDIGSSAFCACSSLESVTIPESVTDIGSGAFSGCKKLADESGMVIVQGILFDYTGPGGNVVIPDGVTSIGWCAFKSCSSLTSVIIPKGVTTIGLWAFCDCSSLTSVTIPESVVSIEERAFGGCEKLKKVHLSNPKCKINKDIFGGKIPAGLRPHIADLIPLLTDRLLKQDVLTKTVWKKLSSEQQAELFLTRQSKPLLSAYLQCVKEPDALGRAILQKLAGKPSAKICNGASIFMMSFSEITSPELLRQLWEALKPLKTAAKALQDIAADKALMEVLQGTQKTDEPIPTAEQKVLKLLQNQKRTTRGVQTNFNEYYGLTPSDLPTVQYTDGKKADPLVLMWLLTAHEKQYDKTDLAADYNKPGLRPEAAEIVAELDAQSFQACLRKLADMYLGLSGRSKKMFLAYPICRYADAALMDELTRRAPSWRSAASGNDSPALYTFRMANTFSNTRAAMMFADKYHDLEQYAWIRETTADDIRDRFLSDVGLDVRGSKAYDLGNQTVTARLQKDLSFLVELPTGKTAKSLPKKGADPEKYAVANADFSEMKKNAKKIVKNRVSILLGDFLSGRTRTADAWKESYLKNPLLRQVGSLLVWAQDGNTFLLTDTGAITADGTPYSIGNTEIALAHPMEMTGSNLTAWQKHFTAHGLKQPFAQIWEPVYRAEDIQPDRYAGCALLINQLRSQDKHGISFDYSYDSSELYITFQDCTVDYEIKGDIRHYLSPDAAIILTSFQPGKFTRAANHIVGLLDKWTIYGRILKDDTSAVELLKNATLAQITDYLNLAMKNNCTNVTALLLDYQAQHFADFDPMAEFTLEDL